MDSQWAHFYQKTYQQRREMLAEFAGLSQAETAALKSENKPIFNHLIENYLTDYALPEGIATNLKVNGRRYLVPMVTEEPSVIAAASNGSKLLAAGDGIAAKIDQRLLTGQIILKDVADKNELTRLITDYQSQLIKIANDSHPQILKHGGGARSLSLRQLDEQFFSIDLTVDPGEAMGANLMNTMLEAVADYLRSLAFQVTMAILSNIADKSLVTVTGKVAFDQLGASAVIGKKTAERIVDAATVAQLDPKRAVTHNKGIMNGVDAVVMATGNDWRAVESAAHAFAARNGRYKGLSTWKLEDHYLVGQMTLPLSLGIVGGATSVLPLAAVNKKMMQVNHVQTLMAVTAALGLAQNLAALKALVTDGIQKGHMNLQLRSLAMANGAVEAELPAVVARLRQMPRPSAQAVRQILKELRKKDNSNG
ncbi:hydroxymethylglutaryl-CoA reductase, degradative [Lentilactobacillus farraginis]|uniref:3-hydroxy-3-methylglutaryl coenzyme A reductase n=1 Tax=Lentilactobacillus farraginis DSM 18382 = JCM 14108 TaxID=1423743 RepID=X0PAF1_9LACO|nr:hydroxymethylglutaryl-CoA reductase, degradative [Lentilactobacillus farraginis]KRM09586.1 hydroxymethylglutaryl-CoA reductase [Lentilactobacillus farraginis DSM 18382 = JCM 14108]GAF36333.1 hydroxymethylglutaryl-CoA reductase [Lentilactobacillus farraginis DSM 18382 = JCM 14108]